MAEQSNEATEAAVAAARAFAEGHVVAAAADWELARRFPVELLPVAGEAGLLGLMAPPTEGGRGLGLTGTAAVAEVLAAADMGIAFSLKVHANFTASIARIGSPLQRERYLADMLAGRRIGAFLLTEPDVGSDATKIRTQARRTASGWVLSGEKAWTTNGVAAGLMQVFAQTDPSLGWRGIASFLVEGDTAGVERLPAYGLLGAYGAGVCGIRLHDVTVGEDALFLAPGDAFKGAMRGINIARVGVAAMCTGMMASALDHALRATVARSAFDQAIADFQGVQWMLADAATDLEAARLLTREAARAFDADEDAVVACAHAKKFAARAAWKAISDCMQVMGARGFRLDDGHPLARHLAAARMTHWLDGATEIQNVVIARELLRPYRAAG
ncbi:MAG: acyl-CoA dehydrogenase family protein [Proteobacteria bacterium]|nr:acyl-CoA dehydrogenase family protein [Pseudomonadota bacterium]